MTASKHIFGPVPSRRLGRSLGVDLVPFKTCSYDCVYCQLGQTTHKTIDRQPWVCLDDILPHLRQKLSTQPDYITLSGSGEPTLHSQIDKLIHAIKSETDIPVAVLTNGSLLWRPDVRQSIMEADLVMPSLDAGDAATFERVNQPHAEITFPRLIDGLIRFREQFKGQYWLEILLVKGITDDESQIQKIVDHVAQIMPDRVQLNTVVRPPAVDGVKAVEPARLAEWARMFEPEAEVVADHRDVHQHNEFGADRDQVLALLKRRPCTVSDVADGLGLHPNAVIKHLRALEPQVESVRIGGKVYFKAPNE